MVQEQLIMKRTPCAFKIPKNDEARGGITGIKKLSDSREIWRVFEDRSYSTQSL
jgi:hypothetical protein